MTALDNTVAKRLGHFFPFGRPVLHVSRPVPGPRQLFILGAYPSALHVAWTPPPGKGKPVKAVAVDNEPEPFWTGTDQDERVAAWTKAVGFIEGKHGRVSPVGELNGSSGCWVDDNVLRPLKVGRSDAWITDCLDTYRCSEALAKRLEDTYSEFAVEAGLPASVLSPHPGEDEIVAEALQEHRQRLLQELEAARPSMVVTLGNAALRVFRGLVAESDRERPPTKLSAGPDAYGLVLEVSLGEKRLKWLPLAHPAAPKTYQEAHSRWAQL